MVRREDVAHAVADAALAVAGVARLGSGDGFVEAATQYPGGKVVGVRLTDDVAEVHIVAGRSPLPALAAEVRAAVGAVLDAAGRPGPVTVIIDDIEDGTADRRAAAR